MDFNVPFLLYAPSLIRNRIDLDYATSHVDIAPTLYDLVGVPTDSLLLHGENMLDSRLEDHAIFVMNTGIYPTGGFEFRSHRFDVSRITSETRITPALDSTETRTSPWSAKSIRSLLDSANHVFNLTAAQFLTREKVKSQR